MKYHTAKDRKRAVELYREGHSTRKVAELTGVNKQTVYEWVRDAGVLRTKSQADRLMNGVLNEKDYAALEERAVFLYNAPMSTWQVANLLGVTRSTVRRWLDKRGIPRRSASAEQSRRQRQTSGRLQRIAKARAMRQSGMRIMDIADHIGVHRSTVSTWLGNTR